MKAEKILIAAVVGCLLFCFYLAYRHGEMIHTRNLHPFLGEPVAKNSDLRGPIRKFAGLKEVPVFSAEIKPEVVIYGIANTSLLSSSSIASAAEYKAEAQTFPPTSRPTGAAAAPLILGGAESIVVGMGSLKPLLAVENRAKEDPGGDKVVVKAVEPLKFLLQRKSDVYLALRAFIPTVQFASMKGQDNEPVKERSNIDIFLAVENFHSLLRSGTHCRRPASHEIPQQIYLENIQGAFDIVQRLFFSNKYSSFIELTSSKPDKSIGQYLAAKHHNGLGSYDPKLSTFATVGSQEITFLVSSKATSNSTSASDFLCPTELTPNLFVSTSGYATELEGMYNCLQFLDDISMLVNDQLPFEFERTFGELMCRCNDTLVERQLPDTV